MYKARYACHESVVVAITCSICVREECKAAKINIYGGMIGIVSDKKKKIEIKISIGIDIQCFLVYSLTRKCQSVT